MVETAKLLGCWDAGERYNLNELNFENDKVYKDIRFLLGMCCKLKNTENTFLDLFGLRICFH